MNDDFIARNADEKKKKRTKITIVSVAIALVLCIVGVVYATTQLNHNEESNPFSSKSTSSDSPTKSSPSLEETEKPTSTEESTPVESTPETSIPESSSEEPETESPVSVEEYEAAIHAIQPGVQFAHFSSEATITPSGDNLLDKARTLAAGYDYDAAIELLSDSEGYKNNDSDYVEAMEEIEAAKAEAVRWPTYNNITHIFFHTLIADPTLTFDESVTGVKAAQYNEVMTTIDEFVKMMEEMYEKGYVLVSLHQIAAMETQDDGSEKMVYQDIYLPEGKTPFVLSVDDVSYYEYMDGHGFATRLIAKNDGSVVNEMKLTDGSTVEGAFDVLPILEEFCKLHPDFSYQGARGILALTGYNGVFGYHTSDFWYKEDCDYYISNEKNDAYKATEVTSPNPNLEEDKATATQVAQAIRDLGWELASHSWGHKQYGQMDIDLFKWDADLWEKEVEPILGETDILIFAFGDDIGTWRGYDDDNERYTYLKSLGFNYFCNVDSNQYYMQLGEGYFRQGRRNLDGQRMWEAIEADNGVEGYKNRLSDLFDDVSAIFDPLRPTPVE